LGRVFIEEAMQKTGINRTDLVGVCTYLIRTKQASGQNDAVKRLESGEFNGVDFEELIIQSYQDSSLNPEEEVDNTTET